LCRGNRVTDLLPRGIRLFSCVAAWPWPTAICTAVALAFGSFSYCAVGYLHYKRIAGDERIAAQRAERANLHLQHELDRLRGESVNHEERQTASSEQDPASRIAAVDTGARTGAARSGVGKCRTREIGGEANRTRRFGIRRNRAGVGVRGHRRQA